MSEPSDIKFTCQECGKEFDPDPDTMRELHWEPQYEPEAGPMEEAGDFVSLEEIEEASIEELAKVGITPENKEQMLQGETVVAGALCICRECQDRLLEEQS